MCECQPLQTQHFFIFLFASLKKWLFAIIFVTLCYSYSMEHQLSQLLLVFLAGYFGFQVSARQLSAESGAERASKRRTNCVHLFSTHSWMVNLLQDKVDVLSCSQTKICKKIFSAFTSLTFCGEEFWIIVILQWHF